MFSMKKFGVAVAILSLVANAAAACDMVVVTPKGSADGSMIWAKNSNRNNEECMTFKFHQGGKHEPGETVKVSHTTIPQAPVTYSVIGAEPFEANKYKIQIAKTLVKRTLLGM